MAGGTATEVTDDQIQPGTMMALVAMGLGVFVIANDFTALNVALPAIEGDLNADVGSAQWVINAYALVFGMAIVSGGRLADMFGRRRIFLAGLAIFTLSSLFCGLAGNPCTPLATWELTYQEMSTYEWFSSDRAMQLAAASGDRAWALWSAGAPPPSLDVLSRDEAP